MFDPATIPALDSCLRRRVFRAHIFRRAINVTFRGATHKAAKNEPSAQRKMVVSGYTQETADLEIMLALASGSAAPVPNSSDGVTVDGIEYRITSVQTDVAPDCYQLTLSRRR